MELSTTIQCGLECDSDTIEVKMHRSDGIGESFQSGAGFSGPALRLIEKQLVCLHSVL